jgi:D-alanyl-D-alanine carboxypeptidase/D-alanyl-D-alanine-endopeptidase (penicillin-binding protein 4)
MKGSLAAASLVTLVVAGSAAAAPKSSGPTPVLHDGAHALVMIAGARARATASASPGEARAKSSPEETTAKEIERLLRGPLARGVTGLVVADARTGDPLFTVNPDEALNPASNVKMISTATALDLLGADFHYVTRIFGPAPDDTGVLHGDVYLLGSYDPTLASADLDALAAQLAARGVHGVVGDLVVGSDPSRDGLYRATIPIAIEAGDPGKAPTATADAGDLVTCKVTATTARYAARPRLTYKTESTTDAAGHTHAVLTIGGAIGKGSETTYQLPTIERTTATAYQMRAALFAHGIDVTGSIKIEELGDFVGDAVGRGALPLELARHDSAALADIVAHVNKWSINWLADRVIMTAAALHDRTKPTMEGAVAAMYGWLARHPHVAKNQLVVDTGSGLSYHTQITTHELVAIVRSAAGFTNAASGGGGGDDSLAKAWLASLSVAGRDGTLTNRFHAADVRGLLRGKTGTLSTAIALSGVLAVDPARPVVLSIVTNTKSDIAKGSVRKAHELLVEAIVRYLARTAKHAPAAAIAPPAEPTVSRTAPPPDLQDAEPDESLDAETAAEQ